MDTAPEIDSESYDIEDSADILGLAKTLINGHHPGILGTIDQSGKPQIRWMSTLSFDEFPIFYTLTAPDSRKVAQINRHPDVNWMFFNRDKSLILNLAGKARILKETAELKRVWKQIEDKSHLYFLNRYAKAPGFVVIETTVESIECNSPKSALRFTIEASELKEERY